MVNVNHERLVFYIYISAANYDRKHLENSKTELENSWIVFFGESGNPEVVCRIVYSYSAKRVLPCLQYCCTWIRPAVLLYRFVR